MIQKRPNCTFNQATERLERRILYLEEALHLLLANQKLARFTLAASVPCAGSFKYSKDRGLIPLLPETTARSLFAAQSSHCGSPSPPLKVFNGVHPAASLSCTNNIPPSRRTPSPARSNYSRHSPNILAVPTSPEACPTASTVSPQQQTGGYKPTHNPTNVFALLPKTPTTAARRPLSLTDAPETNPIAPVRSITTSPPISIGTILSDHNCTSKRFTASLAAPDRTCHLNPPSEQHAHSTLRSAASHLPMTEPTPDVPLSTATASACILTLLHPSDANPPLPTTPKEPPTLLLPPETPVTTCSSQNFSTAQDHPENLMEVHIGSVTLVDGDDHSQSAMQNISTFPELDSAAIAALAELDKELDLILEEDCVLNTDISMDPQQPLGYEPSQTTSELEREAQDDFNDSLELEMLNNEKKKKNKKKKKKKKNMANPPSTSNNPILFYV